VGFPPHNFVDVCVRMGLYESAKKYVGWPITPGFEFSGKILSFGGNQKDHIIEYTSPKTNQLVQRKLSVGMQVREWGKKGREEEWRRRGGV